MLEALAQLLDISIKLLEQRLQPLAISKDSTTISNISVSISNWLEKLLGSVLE